MSIESREKSGRTFLALHEDDEAIELDNVELEDSEEDTEESESHMEKFSAMLRQSLADEHEAAADYTKRAAKCEKHGLEDAAKLFRDIAQEEVVHAGEFQALMEKYGLLDQNSIEQGEQEAQEILSGEKTEPEIDADVIPADDTENESAKGENDMMEDRDTLNATGYTSGDDELRANMKRAWDMDKVREYSIKSNLEGEKDLPAREYTERSVRNIYTSYWRDEMYPENWDELSPVELKEIENKIRDKAWNTPIEEVIEYLNNTGDMTVTRIEATDEDAASAGTIASNGEVPTGKVGDGVVEAEPTKICEELKALQEALKG